MLDFKLPELGENIDKAEVIRVLIGEGDRIKADQTVLEVESEKAAMPLPSPRAGRVAKVHVKEGDSVAVGQTLLSIEEGDGAEEPKKAAKETAESKQPARQNEPAPWAERKPATEEKPPRQVEAGDGKQRRPAEDEEIEVGARVAAGPATRRLARELGVDLTQVEGSGPGGRITPEDVQSAIRNRTAGPRGEAPALPDFGKWGKVERQPLNAIARTSAQRLQVAWQQVPHVTQHALADVTDLEAARQQLVEAGAKITVTALAVKAAAVALREFPHVNSSYDAAKQELILKRYVHIGVAVDTKHGLLVPVIRNADQKSVRHIAGELAELAEKARNRQLGQEHMEGGSFTISNLGGIGGTAFTPIVNYPEVAILGIARTQQQLVQREGRIETRRMLPLSLSYDHRVVNGADGARFVTRLAELLAEPMRLLIDI
jgi:pyruvate dehydrogenase E2 component (dihydrolipoamide acetyltransferase)